jgi:2'-5' RNA ligase
MPRELDLRLVATPIVELPNVGLGDLSSLSESERSTVIELASVADRRKLAAESKAMSDGSFPIRNVPDLKKALQAYGLAKNKPRVKRFIVRRARALSRADLLPEAWGVTRPTAVLAAGDGGPENGIMVAIYPPPELASQLAGGQPGDLAPDDLHVTLAYLGTTDDITPEQFNAAREAIGEIANDSTPFTAQVQGTGTFNAPESDDPQWYAVDAPGLAALRTRVVQALESVGVQPRVEHDFTPHMTVRYGNDDPAQVPDGGDQPWGVDGLVLKAGPRAEVYTLGHDFFADGDDCALCGQDPDSPLHQAGPPPVWLQAMDNPALRENVGELFTEDGTAKEFVAAPGPCSLNRSPKHNWIEKQGGLPNYICQVARAVARGGKSLESAIPIAISTMKHWAAGGNHNGKKVSPAVQARAAAALAEWEAKRAKAHAEHALDDHAGEFFDWKHGWIPVSSKAKSEEKHEAKRKRLEASRAKNAPKAAAQRGRLDASRAKNADRDAATAQRLANHRNAVAVKKAATGYASDTETLPIAPIEGPSALDLEVTTAEFAWNPDLHPADRHGRPIEKGHKVKPPTGEPGTVVGNAPARGKPVVQVSGGKGGPLSVPADQTEVIAPPENPSQLDDTQLVQRHAAITSHMTDVMQKQVDAHKAAAEDPTAAPTEDNTQAEVDRLATKRKPYADEITKRKSAKSKDGDTVTASAANDPTLEDYSYHWNPDTQETFRVANNGDISVFAPAVDEQEQATWQAIDSYNGATQLADVQTLPKIEDRDTLEVILGSSLALFADAGAPVSNASEPAATAADVATEPAEDTKGRRFRIPIVIPEGVPTGDRRKFAEGALEAKEPPMPLLWQRETDEGHKKSIIVGRIDTISRLESGGLGNAEGVFDTSEEATEARRLVRERYLTGVSGDVDQFESELSQTEGGEDSLLIKHGRLVAATLVAKPAFQEATIEMIPEEGESPVITAAGGPLLPPKKWFFNPNLDGPTMLTVTDDGRVFGHIAEWDTPHLSNPDLKAPRSKTGYRYFNRKPLRTAEGEDVKVGQLTLVGGHAKLAFDPDRAARHYDDTRSAVADVVAGEDEFGVWVAGAMRPDVTPEQVRAFRASEPSGDWRFRDGNLELCAVCQVNTAGFPVMPRALIASGQVMTLVAAGMVGHQTKRRDLTETVAELATEVAALKAEREAERRASLLETVQSLRV